MSTFCENYCAARRCRGEEFTSRLFWRCLHPHAIPLAPFFATLRPGYFLPDLELIQMAGRARTLHDLNEELRDFMNDARNRLWWRKRAQIRLSTRRLRRVARLYLAQAESR